MTSPLPERPNIEQLKNQAKSLLRAAHAKDPAALVRFQALPTFGPLSIEQLASTALALHDAQSVIAREHGFASWSLLREHIEERSLSFAAAVDEFIRCATGEAPARAERLLAQHPGLVRASYHAALVIGDVATVEARLAQQPEVASQTGGPQDWEPLQYVCHTCLHRGHAERSAGLVAIARRLLKLGANPNAHYNWRWHAELPRTVLWGALCAMDDPALAAVLLEAGATVDDGVSLHICAGGGNLAALELLHAHGANVNGIPGGLPALRYILDWSTNEAGPRWLLDHGADPNLRWGDLNEAAIHVAARRWSVSLVAALAAHGADLLSPRVDGRTPHTIAELNGNHAVAEWLLAHGAKDELTELDRFVAACARADETAAAAMLRATPALRTQLRPEHHLMLQQPAERGELPVLRTMLACGFDPAVADKDGITALHRAAMSGRVDSVRLLLAHGAPVNAIETMFYGTPLIWATEGSTGHKGPGTDHIAVVRELIAAGSTLEWNPPPTTPGREKVLEVLDELKAAAAALR